MTTTIAKEGEVPLVDAGRALESYRSSGFDLPTAVGEAIDNSLQAGATIVRVHLSRSGKSIPAVAIADNGTGIPTEMLDHVLVLGYSSRYNDRNGMGRFGVGLKHAGLSQGRRIDVWTSRGDEGVHHTYLDLDMVLRKEQTGFPKAPAADYPSEYRQYMSDPELADGGEFRTGTLVVWSNVDQISNSGRYKTSAEEAVSETIDFLSRAYRRFIDGGVRLYVDNKLVTLHDPLFQLPNPRLDSIKVDEKYKPLRATVIYDDTFPIDDVNKKPHEVRLVVSAAPQAFRVKRGEGGSLGAKITRIGPDIQGRVSLMRQGREIYYDIIPRSFPKGVTDIDRFIGVEISFPAALDESFRVRSVKRGAEPDRNLRDEIRNRLKQPITAARKLIREFFAEVPKAEADPDHQPAVDSVNRKAGELPRGQAGPTPEGDIEKKIVTALTDEETGEPSPERVAHVKERIAEGKFEVLQGSWPGRDLLDLTHINGAVLVKLNRQHPVLARVYDEIADAIRGDESTLPSPSRTLELLRTAKNSLDALLLGYAKAESFDRDADEKYRNLRMFWGAFAATFFEEIERSEERLRP